MAKELILLLSDIHANEQALSAVIRDSQLRYGSALTTWFIGDLFGRGPAPIGVWYRLIHDLQPEVVIAGNHDWGVIGRLNTVVTGDGFDGHFNPQTDWKVIARHREELTYAGLLNLDPEFAGGEVGQAISWWPLVMMPRQGVWVLHGGADRKVVEDMELTPDAVLINYIWGYVKNKNDVSFTFEFVDWLIAHSNLLELFGEKHNAMPPKLIITGHYHYRRFATFSVSSDVNWINPIELDHRYQILPSDKTFISPGSVGFPYEIGNRDAAYAVLELIDDIPVSIAFHAVAYDRSRTKSDMDKAGYPRELIDRLD